MAWQSNIPLPKDKRNISQADLQGNFQALDIGFNIDHQSLDAAVGTLGKHKATTLTLQADAASTAALQFAIYNKKSEFTPSRITLYLRAPGDGTAYDFISNSFNDPSELYPLREQNGFSRLPCGLLLKWGWRVRSGGATIKFKVNDTTPVFSAVYTMMLTVSSPHNTKTASYKDLDTEGFTITPDSGNAIGLSFLALGV